MPGFCAITSSKPFLRSMAGEAPGVPSSSMMVPWPPSLLDDVAGRCAAAFHVVGADVHEHLVRVGLAVDRGDGDPGLHRLLDGRARASRRSWGR